MLLTATYYTFWLTGAALSPEYGAMIKVFEDAEMKKGLLNYGRVPG